MYIKPISGKLTKSRNIKLGPVIGFTELCETHVEIYGETEKRENKTKTYLSGRYEIEIEIRLKAVHEIR